MPPNSIATQSAETQITPLRFSTPEELENLWNTYMRICKEREETINFAGLFVVLGITRKEFDELIESPVFGERCRKYKNLIENTWVQGLRETPAGCSFYLKNTFPNEYQEKSSTINIGLSLTNLLTEVEKK